MILKSWCKAGLEESLLVYIPRSIFHRLGSERSAVLMLASCFFGRAAEMPEKPPNQMKLGIETGSTKHRQHL